MSTPASGRRPARWLIAIAAVVVASVLAVVAESTPTAVRAGVTTTVAPTTTTTSATAPSLPPPADEASDPVHALVPNIVAVDDTLTAAADRQLVVSAALTEGTNAVAVPAPPGTLCAVVPLSAPLMAAGRWERNGDTLAESALTRRDPPGYGDCITAEDVGDFDDGAYQYVAIGESGATSAVATIVVGVPSVAAWLLNDGDQPVCLVQLSPSDADFYEGFADVDGNLAPGEALAIRVAAVEHDVRVYGCPPDDVLASLDLVPQAGVYVELFGGEEPDGSTPAVPGATTTTPRPTTTG